MLQLYEHLLHGSLIVYQNLQEFVAFWLTMVANALKRR
jgi:hypothetical protein